MNVIKRNGSEVDFDAKKIAVAVAKANKDIREDCQIPQDEIDAITFDVLKQCMALDRSIHVEEIQDFVEKAIADRGYFEAAKSYILYRYKRALARQKNTTDDKILALINEENEEIKQENSNKNPTIASVKRDYIAGEVSKDLCRRFFFPKEVMDAHDSGKIHVHK